MNTALILSAGEWGYLMEIKNNGSSEPIEILNGAIGVMQDCNRLEIVASLQEKRLAVQDGDSLVLEPLLNLVVEEAALSYAIEEISPGAFALRCPNMCLLFMPYEWGEKMWRIAAFRDMGELTDFLGG